MKFIYIAFAVLILAGGVVVYYQLTQNQDAETIEPVVTEQLPVLPANYVRLRQQFLTYTPDMLDITLPPKGQTVYGVIMESTQNNVVMTLFTTLIGQTVVYRSDGVNYFGGRYLPGGKTAPTEFTKFASKYLDKMDQTAAFPYATEGNVRYFLLTNEGDYTREMIIPTSNDEESGWSELYFKGIELIELLKKNTEDNLLVN
ncbi:MAG: hypothetical protein IIA45_10255 [Bacteroidetes bacterium]|nr:hypothetical protein [Bacteroidota bacterium]